MTYPEALAKAEKLAAAKGIHFAAATLHNESGQDWYNRLSDDLEKMGYSGAFNPHAETETENRLF